jgi:hypothetical protein
MRSLATVGARIEQVARQRLFQPRRVFCVAGTEDRLDRKRIAALEAEGAEVVVILSGVPRNPDEAEGGMVEHEIGLQPCGR